MKYLMFKYLFLILFSLSGMKTALWAQSPLHPCGTPGGKSEWLNRYQQHPAAFAKNPDSLHFVALSVQLTADNNGIGYFPTNNVLDALCRLNADFLQANIQFYVPDAQFQYLPNAAWDNHASVLEGAAMMFGNNIPNTLNTYIVTTAAGNCGYNLPYAGIALAKSCSGATSHTWAHEVGHALGLPHPFLGWEGGVSHDNSVPHNFNDPAPAQVTYNYTYFQDTLILDTLIIDTAVVELVDRSNCLIAGDGFCDTGADFLASRWTCNSNGLSAQAQTDPVGEVFRSDGTLIMSYANDACQTRFSEEQIQAMRAFLLERRTHWINQTFTPLPVSAVPATLLMPIMGQPSPVANTILSWSGVNNASHYLVQVSRLANFGVTEEYITTDTMLPLPVLLNNRTYHWRVRAFNSHSFCTSWSPKETFLTATIASSREFVSSTHGRIIPNPVRAGEQIRVSDAGKDAQFSLFSSSGIPVIRGWNPVAGDLRIPEYLPPGVYYLQVIDEHGAKTYPLVVTQ
jgi:hypothetical protein